MSDDGWISVEDAMPIDGRTVLGWDGEDVRFAYHIAYEGRCWWTSNLRVTHWQPLPGPPGE